MKATDIDRLEAGRPMDALVAEKVMGWERIEGDIATIWCLDGAAYDFPEVPHYSTDIDAAWEVYEKIARDSFCLRRQGNEWTVWMHVCEDPHEWVASGPTAALAICRAALKEAEDGNRS